MIMKRVLNKIQVIYLKFSIIIKQLASYLQKAFSIPILCPERKQ